MKSEQRSADQRLQWVDESLDSLARQSLLRERRTVIPGPNARCQIDGRELIDFGSNDYLGLAFDPRVINAAEDALKKYGAGARASSLISGRTAVHAELEEEIARFENQPAALLFPTGYAANLGVISALVGQDDVVFCDRLNHACLVDGCRLSRAKLKVYRHRNLDRLETELRTASKFRRRLIVTDGVFSMDGDLAPLTELCDLAERFDAMLLVDEAHGTGVFGPDSRGGCNHCDVEQRVTIRVGTLSKAIGSQGGFATGDARLIEWLRNSARTQMFSTALSPAACGAAAKAIQIIRSEPERSERLRELVVRFRERVGQFGMQASGHAESPIIPMILGDADIAVESANRLQEAGFFVPAIRPPTVPEGTSRLRITLSAAHSSEDIDRLAEAFGHLPIHQSDQILSSTGLTDNVSVSDIPGKESDVPS